ncbi:MerR family transcriptional regulator [Cohnella zeiphila]|uniref:MerR family transcriptional regulator n=1 Tax=Cohnella zeiphila TaxID=2761120 RepID=A0A7X0VXP3_9BACL|nr:MerR family transcriptional regulator [Cohnella zeiphila]MBB6733825.1 MerR family transcriptional regulator [Cohnella zeiphila]
MNREWKIGELAKRTGLTVRTLHHYDRIGLLSPSRATESGHRLYLEQDLRKLQQVIMLKELGFPLEEIKVMLSHTGYDPGELLHGQLVQIEEQIRALEELRDRVRTMHDHLQTGHPVTAESFLDEIRFMNMMRNPYFPPEQMKHMRSRFLARSPGERAEGGRLMGDFRDCRDRGKPTDDPEVAALARRWKEEIHSVASEDGKWVQAAEKYYRDHPREGFLQGMDGELYAYIKKAVAELDGAE